MGFWGNMKRTANFYEDGKTIICDLTGLDRKSAHAYIADHADLFKAVIDQDIPVQTGLMLVSNYLLKNLLEDTPHTSPLLKKYEVGLPRGYDLIFVSYQILSQDREEFADIINQVDEKMKLARAIFQQRPDIAQRLGISEILK